jgi:tetratricopeptide (TPR) repeat protein
MFYIERAKYLNSIKNNKAVLKDVHTAVSLAPTKPGVLLYAAKELSRSEQYEENIKIADSYIARNTSSSDSNNWLSCHAYKIRSENKFALKDYVGALEDSIKSIELIPFTGDEFLSQATKIKTFQLELKLIIYPN